MSRAYRLLAVPFFLALTIVPAQPASHRMEKSLDRLEPVTRMMEICGIKAGEELRRERAYKAVNRVVVDAIEAPEIDNNVVAGTGGAFRHKGHWYQLQFECTLTEDQRSAVSVDFVVGDEIPEAQWEDYGLWK
ncbi:DUF930 domain-containing protein [Microvirga brassicacearum]|nr:DUF930 domain-containing protein [Microvirga brassicacearum]